MEVILENKVLSVTISSHGAEITSIMDKRSGRECVWTGNPTWWKRHAPVLFPIVGSLWQGTMRIDGKEYHMSQHGFARDMEFECVMSDSQRAIFSLRSNESTKAVYPFDFELVICHEITDEATVHTFWSVRNTGDKEMHFQLGGHPAFNIPDIDPLAEIEGYVVLDDKAPYRQTLLQGGGCVAVEDTTYGSNEIALRRDTFSNDALIFESPCPHKVQLLDRHRRPVLTFSSDCPALGIWAPDKGELAPFVCIEPWWGRTDRYGYTGEYRDREYVQHLAPKASASGHWEVTFI